MILLIFFIPLVTKQHSPGEDAGEGGNFFLSFAESTW